MRKNDYFYLGLVLVLLSGCEQAPPPQAQFPTNVIGAVAEVKNFSQKISMVGTLASNESVEIKNEVSGTLEKVTFEEGESVKKGDLLFQIDKQKLKAAFDQAQANLSLAEATARRYETLVQSNAVSQQEYEQARATLEANRAAVALARESLEDATITAPFSGIMGSRVVSEGQYLSQGTLLSYLYSNHPMKLEFYVPERFLGEVRVGQTLEIRVAAYPEEVFKGRIYFVDPQIDRQTRTALVKATVANMEGHLKSGMFASLDLIVRVNADAILIPESALMVSGEQVSVFVIAENKTAEPRQVTLGGRRDGWVEVLSGVNAGEVVVVEGYQKIGPGSPVNVQLMEAEKT